MEEGEKVVSSEEDAQGSLLTVWSPWVECEVPEAASVECRVWPSGPSTHLYRRDVVCCVRELSMC